MTTTAGQKVKAFDDAIERIGGIDALFAVASSQCRNPGGHVFATSCGETKCLYCPKIAWR